MATLFRVPSENVENDRILESPATNQAANANEKKVNGTTERSDDSIAQSTTTYRKIKPKMSSFEVTGELRPIKTISLLKDKITDNTDNPDSCNGITSKTCVNDSTADKLKERLQDSSLTESSDSKPSTNDTNGGLLPTNMSNVVVVSSVPKTNVSKDVLKNSKVYVLNGNVLKEASEAEKSKGDNINIICLTNSFGNVIKRIPYDSVMAKNMKSLINTSGGDAEKTKTVSAVPSFIQLSQNNLKNLSPKITLNVAQQASNSSLGSKPIQEYEILRKTLTENGAVNTTTQYVPKEAPSLRKPVDKNNGSGSAATAQKKEQSHESSAVMKARLEFNRCRRMLIEAAIHPQLPSYEPPAGYKGPVFTCEECEDSYTTRDSLRTHKDRRSVLFTYACPVCKRTLEFYNRCMFLLHVRSHDTAVKACFLTISTIPANKLHFRVLESDNLTSQENFSSSSSSAGTNENRPVESQSQRPTSPKNHVRVVRMAKRIRTSRYDPLSGECSPTYEYSEAPASPPTVESDLNTAAPSPTDVDEAADSDSDHPSSDEDSAIDEEPEPPSPPPPEIERPKRKPDEEPAASKSKKQKIFRSLLKPQVGKSSSGDAVGKSATSEKKEKLPDVTVAPSSAVSGAGASVSAEEKARLLKARTSPKRVMLKSPTTTTTGGPKFLKNKIEEITLTSSDEEEVAMDGDKNNAVTCRECREDVPSLTAHYRASNRPMKEYACETCKFFNPSPCALAAHIRIHSKSQPYVCPDCGFYFSTFDSFQIHVKQVCYYDFKTIRFKCPECSLLKPSVPQFADHLKRCHIREVYKCSVCITSSYSAKVVQAHMGKVHPEVPVHLLEGYRCMLCPNLLVAKQSINVHVKRHVFGLQYLRYVYICKCCRQYASGHRAKFETHYEECAGLDERRSASPSPPTKGKSSSAVRSRKTSTDQGGVEEVVERDPLTVEAWEADKLKAEFVPKTKFCVMCRTTKLNDHTKSLFCNACVSYVNADEPNDASAENVQKTEVIRAKRKFKCKLCKQFMNRDWSTITRHYEQDHQADFDVGAGARSKPPADTNAGQNSAPRKRKSSSAKSDSSSSKSPKSDRSVERTDAAKYKCVKCGMCTTARNDFHAHIASHKAQSNTDIQCLECGECFIVRPSLEKHLIVVHKIRDLNEYYRENKVDGDGGDAKDERALSENQCEVCYMECGSKQNYDKHIRTHGMAFVAMQSRAKS